MWSLATAPKTRRSSSSAKAPSYIQKVGAYVNDKMDDILTSAKVGRTDAAVLTAANIADELFKAQAEASDLRREVFRLTQKLEQKRG